MNSDNVLNILWKGVKSKPRISLPKKKTQVVQDELIKVKKEESDSEESDVEEITETKLVKVEAETNPEHVGLRRKNGITVKGKNLPPPLESFDELVSVYGVDKNIVNNLKSAGYDGPTPIQMQAIPALLKGRQVLACAPTGSGKTVAFMAPVLASLGKPSRKGFRALILSPTRELAKQIFRECTLLSAGTGLKANYITKVRQDDAYGTKFSSKFDVLISTPNRLIHLLRLKPDLINLRSVEWLVVDESDKLFEAGTRGFRDQLAEIYKACDNENLKRAMFSATYTVHVARWCRKNLKKVVEITVGHRNTTVDKVEQELVYAGSEAGKLHAFRELIRKGISPPVLVFVQSKDRAKQLFNELIYDGINVDVIHSDRTQHQRDNVVRAFREGKIWVLICTDIMGRGIDFVGIKLVVNYDFPNSAISYIHRIGRTGRAGMSGRAVTYFTDEDKPALRTIARVMKDSGCPVPEYMLSLKKTSKRDRLKMENTVPNREDISTEAPKLKRFKSNKKSKKLAVQ
uniref:Probable ATP-dependent RNA helicase DDX52 n=1 Tax=Lygus hesperus TaxID=30085 RepID=A0A146MG33_LYGHE